MIAFRFMGAGFLMLFSSPFYEAGEDAELLAQYANDYYEGVTPPRKSRMVKFCRTDAEAEFFNPDAHPLPDCDIRDFMEFLAVTMVLHMTAVDVPQYLYVSAHHPRLRSSLWLRDDHVQHA